MDRAAGEVCLVGAGSGAPDLLTLAQPPQAAIESASARTASG